MINIYEVSIGDWLEYEGGTKVKVVSIQDFGKINGESITKFSPIPITHELLGKNGFTYYSPTFSYHHPKLEVSGYGFQDSSALIRNGDSSLTIRVGNKAMMTLRYVHELQHFLRLSKIKIDVEI